MFGKNFILAAFLIGSGVLADPKLNITPPMIPNGQYGSVYPAQNLKAGGGNAPYTFSVTGGSLPPGLSLSSSGTLSGTATAAGSYSFTVTATDQPNDKGKSNTGTQDYTVTIGRAPLTITANDASIAYGQALPALTASYSGFVNGDNASNLTTPPSITTTATSSSPAGSYPITVSGAVDPNYTITYKPGTLTIGRPTLVITANDVSITYGQAIPTLTASYSGFVNGDNVSSLTTRPTITTTATSSSPAGTYPITAAGAVDPNYTIVYNPGRLTIGLAALAITANAQQKEYGAPDPPLTYTASGFLNGDNTGILTGSLTRAAGENVGSYPITQGSLSAGGKYTINYTGNNLTITKASQQITWKQSLLVGCNATTTLQLTATTSSGLPVNYSVSDPSIATVSGNILTLLHPGAAVVTATQAGDANHAAAQAVADTLLYQSASLIRQHWNDVLLFDNSSGAFVQWQWYKNGQAIAGATGDYYSETPALNGQYYVIATNGSGQQIQTCTLTVTGDTTVSQGIKVRPNPVSGGSAVTVSSSYGASALQGAILMVLDLNGRVQQQITSVQPSMQVTMPSEPGIYIINLLLTNGQKASVNVLVVD